ncbi:hypothetical protein BGX27_010158 [Mortierella sp. AM989]|nr:hypothetical protein BGX27_010158 [Mortierella sp. AM989]
MQYKSLWEVQLALGEIPGMFEGNILQPYQSRNHQPTQQTRQQPYSSQLDQQQYQSSYQHYTFPDLSSTPSTSELNSIEDCPEHSLGYYSDYESDQTENEMNEDCLWSFSPRQNDISRNSNFRHDRKDSGVFVHDDEEGIIQITSKSRVFECKSELSDWCDLDVYDYESEYGNLAQKSRAIGGGFHQMEVGSLMPPPSLLGTVSTLS